MQVLVIGGTRFMGPIIVRGLVGAGHAVTVFHRGETAGELPEGVSEILGDRENLNEHADRLLDLHPDVVIDMIALTQKHAADLVDVFAGSVRRIVMISSCDVYQNYGLLRKTETGPTSPTPLTEESPLRTEFFPYRDLIKDPEDTMYYYDKILVEREIQAQDRADYVILRMPMIYGPGDRQHRLYGYLKRMADKRPAILVDEKRLRWRSMRGYRDNCARAVLLAAVDPRAHGIYNVGEPVSHSEQEWLDILAREMDWRGRILDLPNEELPEYLGGTYDWTQQLEVDSGRIRRELEYNEPVPLHRWLRATIEWELANPPEHYADRLDFAVEDEILARHLGSS
jgi:nucleoside-diphosphate-sugar epimerase